MSFFQPLDWAALAASRQRFPTPARDQGTCREHTGRGNTFGLQDYYGP